MTYDEDPPIDLLWERVGRLWACRVVHAGGALSCQSAPLEPEPVRGCVVPFKPGHGIFRAPGNGTVVLVVGDVEVAAFCGIANPRPSDELVVDAMFDPDWMGCLIVGVALSTRDTSSGYQVQRFFQPNINTKSVEIAP